MTVFAFPAVRSPVSINWGLTSNTTIFPAVLTGTIQTLDRGGERWKINMRFQNFSGADKALMKSFLVQLNGQQHRFTVHDFSQLQRGLFGGTPLVNGVDQTGTSLIIDGCSNSITNWIREGDHFGVENDLKMCTADASSDGSGNITINFTPRLRSAPANNASIITTDPTGIFLLSDNTSAWSNRLGDFSDFVISAIEDISV